jgi:hypothetical protein
MVATLVGAFPRNTTLFVCLWARASELFLDEWIIRHIFPTVAQSRLAHTVVQWVPQVADVAPVRRGGDQ